jgi:hypothetical protein
MNEPHAGPTSVVARSRPSSPRRSRGAAPLFVAAALAALVAAPIVGAPTIALAQPAEPEPAPKAEPAEPKAADPKPAPKAEPAEPKAADPSATPPGDEKQGAKKRQDVEQPAAPPPPPAQPVSTPTSGFSFGSYGRVISGGDLRGRPGRDNDLVARGSRLDESNYVELELRRDDYWAKTNSTTRVVATLALQNPIFHYNGVFDAAIAIRNLYIEESDLGLKNLSVWAGSRMYRGDDAYLLDFWPLDNLNTLGGGVRYEANEGRTQVALHAGTNQPNNGFFKQSVERELPFNQLGATTVDVLNRQRFIGSARLQHVFKVGHAGGIKLVGYGEGHALPAGQREIRPETFQDVEEEAGFVVGGQVGGFTGERSTHVNLFVRYASGLAAFGELGTPNQLGLDKSSAGASELTATFTGNFEAGPFALMAAGYVRSFRNASPDLDYGDLDEATHVDDWRDEVIYQLLVDRFADGDTGNDIRVDRTALGRYQGGDWQGVDQRSSATSSASASPPCGSRPSCATSTPTRASTPTTATGRKTSRCSTPTSDLDLAARASCGWRTRAT